MDTAATPTQVGDGNWARVATGNWHACAIKTDKTLWCWGAGFDGQLGDGSTGQFRPIPAQAGDAKWASVTAGGAHSCGIRDDGTLWCWGANYAGQLGTGSTDGSATPTQIGDGLWASVSAGEVHTCGIRADGTLWCWGSDDTGQVGDGGSEARLSPVRIRGQGWAMVSAGVYDTCGTRQDGSLWCWGGNADGQLGDGTTDVKRTPEQVTGDLCQVVPICGNGIVEAGETCDDGNYASGDGCSADCQVEKCFGVVCAGLDSCHQGGCDPETGLCAVSPTADGSSCDDGSLCTQGDTCQAGACTGGDPVVCTASDQCHEAGTCDGATGTCSNPAKIDGAACNDGNACTQTDTCQAGSCVGSNPVVCAGDQCHDGGMCNTATGACNNPVKPNGTACNDGNACTRTDKCQGGTCAGSNPVTCPAPEPCKLAATCDASSGACVYLPKPDGTACNDGNPCTQTDTCLAGACVGANPVVCTADNQCRTGGECDPSSGACLHPGRPDGTSCNDGNSATSTDTCQAGVCLGIPANPAPVAANLADTLAFIYSGPGASQVGVAAGTIQANRAAGIRGHVRARDGSPLAAVKIAIADHPEFGYANSREDGGYDMVVNGGGSLVVQLTTAGYLKVNRFAVAPWQGFYQVDDVVMIQPDSQVSPVNFTQPSMQVAAGSPVTDQSGTRQASVLVPAGTTATMVLANGTQTSVGALNVRITEFTVGADGPATMPAPLPPATAYTYALSYTADEAIMAGAKRINFNQPVIHYNENFLNLPVGLAVPSGYFDEDQHAWLPSPNGGVVKILSVANGLAQLDVDGSASPASTAAKQAMGISDSELASLAQRYSVGQTLWRVPLGHFSVMDFNLTGAPPPDSQNPSGNVSNNDTTPSSCTQSGSIIECENQVVGERLPIAGTPFSLNYRSNRVRGYKAGNELMLSLSGTSIPTSLMAIKLKVEVAGLSINETFAPAKNLGYRFLWDGTDSEGRQVNGRQMAQVSIGYQYPVQYTTPPDGDFHSMSSFGQLSTNPLLEIAPGRTDTISWQRTPAKLGTYLAKGAAMGGWTIDVNHTYDPAQILWRGNGEREMAVVPDVSSTVAKLGMFHSFGVDGRGTVYYTDIDGYSNCVLKKIDPVTGVASPVVSLGNGANQAPRVIAVAPDGTVFYGLYGQIHRVTGAGQELGVWAVPSVPGSGGTEVTLLAVGPDGVVYYVESIGYGYPGPRLMRLDPNGQFAVVAGNRAVKAYGGDGGPASAATFDFPTSLAVGPDGAIYVAEREPVYRVRRIGTDGIIKTVAGNGTLPAYPDFLWPHAGNGGAATSAQVNPRGLAVGPDNALYIADQEYFLVPNPLGGYWEYPSAIRVVRSGIIQPYAGAGVWVATGARQPDGSPAAAMYFESAQDLALAPDGSLLVYDGVAYGNANYNQIYIKRISPPLPGYLPGTHRVASQDGSEVYDFEWTGRHLDTRDALTDALRYQFGYNSAGVLTSITDASGLITTVERDDAGLATAIVAPNGQRTGLTMGPDGYLAAVDEPGGIHHEYTYYSDDKDGLLNTYTNPRGNSSSFSYDDLGRLAGEAMPAGSSWTLARTGPTQQNPKATVQVTLTSAMGRAQNYSIGSASDGTENRSQRSAAGLVGTSAKTPAGVTSTSSPDGITSSVTEGADPRYNMQAPLPVATTVTTPAGKQMTTTVARATTMNGASLASQVDTTTINGKAFTSTYNVAAKTITSVSPVGRQTVSTLDSKGRVVKVQTGNLAPTAYAYDSRGRLVTVTVGTGTSARVATFGYDPLDRLSSVTDPLARVQSYVYDDANRVVGQVFTDGSQVGFSYDANGNVTGVTPPSRPEHDFGYTPADLMSSYTSPAVAGTGATTYEYNLDKQPTVVHRPDGSTINFAYDSAGRVATVTYPKGPEASDGTITVTRTYSATTGKLASVSASDGQNLSYAYDGSRLTSVTAGGAAPGVVSVTRNNDFRPAIETVAGNAVSLGYDNDGLATQLGALAIGRDSVTGRVNNTVLGSVSETLAYTAFGELQDIETKQATTLLFKQSFVRDAIGRIEQKTETVQGVTYVYTYSYNPAGRLWQVMTNGTLTATYLYDSNGNRISNTTAGGSEIGTYDDQDRMQRYGTWAFTYTANGELRTKTDTTTGAVTTYDYDGMGSLRRVDLPDGRVIDYVVDGHGRRIAKKVNGTIVRRWLYDGQLTPVAEFDGNGALVSRLVGTHYLLKGTSTYRLVKDHLGSPRLVVDVTTGAVVQRLDFDEWGRVLGDTAPGFQPLGFAGGIYDAETGLVRFGWRDYDPDAGRWTAKDPIGFAGGDGNLFAYVGNDPVNLLDPDGRRIHGMFVMNVPIIDPGKVKKEDQGNALLLGEVMSIGKCHCSCDGEPPCGFDATVLGTGTIYYRSRQSPTMWSIQSPGFRVEQHEGFHMDDYRDGFSAEKLNANFQTEGFGSLAECNAAQLAFRPWFDAYWHQVAADSERDRD
jgi:RHS repeat-associated core domain